MSSAPTTTAPPATTLRRASDTDAARILGWRNHPDVRRVMFTDHVIQPAEHAAWWHRVRNSPDHHVLMLAHDGMDCGVVNWARDEDDGGPGCWSWGFYLNPAAFERPLQQLRAWSGMETASLRWAGEQLQARRIHCEVLADNLPVLTLHRRHGFVERDRYQRTRGQQQIEVVRLFRALP